MDTHVTNRGSAPYPQVPPYLERDPTPRDQAIYVPSVGPGFAKHVYEGKWARPLPNGLTPRDLNFLDPNTQLLRLSHVMSSAGQALNQNKPCIITQRNRAHTFMIGDSGGYQIASGLLKINGNQDRLRILRWLEKHSDVAMTLDVPTGPLLKPGYSFTSFKDCLTTPLDHLDFFQKNREEGKIKFLNVLQGNNTQQAKTWYQAVKNYPFEGWAFAGVMRHNFYYLCQRIIEMADENKLQDKAWIHVLGTNEIETAVLLTALQRAINQYINPNLRISFDTSSPFRLLAWNTFYTMPRFDKNRMVMGTARIPDDLAYIGSTLRWPWPSELGNRLTLGDVCVSNDVYSRNSIDVQSHYYINHHNLGALCYGIALANRVFDSESLIHQHSIATTAGAGVEAINEVIKQGRLSALDRYKTTFSNLRHGALPASDDDDRQL